MVAAGTAPLIPILGVAFILTLLFLLLFALLILNAPLAVGLRRPFMALFLSVWITATIREHNDTMNNKAMNEEQRRELADRLATARDDQTIREIVRLGETFLAEQLKSGLAADMRAMTLAAVLAAIIAGLLGGTATLVASDITVWPHVLSIFVLSACLVVSVFSAIHAARPTGFTFAGNNPKRWSPVVGESENLIRALAVQASFYAKGIEENANVLRDNSKRLHRALSWVLIGIGFGVGVEFVILLGTIGDFGFK